MRFVPIAIIILALSAKAKVVEKSCPICGQCEPQSAHAIAISINEPLWICRPTPLKFFIDRDSNTIKWVPKRVEVDSSTWRVRYYPMEPPNTLSPRKHKCVNEIVVQVRDGGVTDNDIWWGTQKPAEEPTEPSHADTTFCDCDGDSEFWTAISVGNRDTVFVRISERWERTTKAVWRKKTRRLKEVYE